MEYNKGATMKMRIIDITKPIEKGRKYYPTLQEPQINYVKHYATGHDHWVSSILMPLHTATHIDAPAHFYEKGRTIDKIAVDELIGFAQVLDFSSEKVITKGLLTRKNITTQIVLFKVNDDIENYTYVSEDAASYLVHKKVKILGTEAPSVDKFGDKTYRVHKLLSMHDVLIVEGLYLKNVEEGIYLFVCAPLLILGVEASPARAFLIRIEN